MNRKGQALLEFIIVLPILLLVILFIADFSNIFYNKIYLENQLNNYINGNEVSKKISFEKKISKSKVEITLSKEINLLNPIMVKILESPYIISTGVIINE